MRHIVMPGGRALIEVNPIGLTRQLTVREQVGDRKGEPFPWAVVSMAGLDELIPGSGWRCESVHQVEQRLVVQLERIA
jgi:hypothetical protein